MLAKSKRRDKFSVKKKMQTKKRHRKRYQSKKGGNPTAGDNELKSGDDSQAEYEQQNAAAMANIKTTTIDEEVVQNDILDWVYFLQKKCKSTSDDEIVKNLTLPLTKENLIENLFKLYWFLKNKCGKSFQEKQAESKAKRSEGIEGKSILQLLNEKSEAKSRIQAKALLDDTNNFGDIAKFENDITTLNQEKTQIDNELSKLRKLRDDEIEVAKGKFPVKSEREIAIKSINDRFNPDVNKLTSSSIALSEQIGSKQKNIDELSIRLSKYVTAKLNEEYPEAKPAKRDFRKSAAAPAPETASATVSSAAVEAKPNFSEDPKFEKYNKMKKMLPEGAVRQKMTTDGFTPSEIDNFFSQTVFAKPEAAAVQAKPNFETDERFEKFIRMKKMLPEGAVRQKMRMEGFTEEEINKFFS